MRLYLTESQARALRDHAQKDAPREACGLLVGVGQQAREVIAVPNIAADPIHHYHLDDETLGRTLLSLDARHLDLVAIYHSHPDGEAIPSPTDIRQATFPDTPYLIVGLRGGPHMAAWQIHYGEVSRVPIDIGLSDIEPETREAALSRAQVVAIILAAILAFAFMIIVSLSLLPPAPVIVTPLP